ncbi:TPA: glycosyltransferase, partial [Escherichia coli]
KRFLFYVLKKCDLVICQSDAMKDLLISKYEFNNNKTVRIYNPIPIANNNESSFEQTDKEILKLLFVGRLSEQKNLDDIIRISQLLRDKGILFLWKVVGKGPLENTFKDLIREHNFQESIVMCGSSHDIENYYKWADITTLVSHYEGLPNVLLESISHRTPCVSYDCPTGPSEIIIHEKNGVLVPQYDVNNFYQSLIRVKELNLKNDNIENTLMKFSEKKVCDEYYKILFKR